MIRHNMKLCSTLSSICFIFELASSKSKDLVILFQSLNYSCMSRESSWSWPASCWPPGLSDESFVKGYCDESWHLAGVNSGWGLRPLTFFWMPIVKCNLQRAEVPMDANNNPLWTLRVTKLPVRLGRLVVRVDFIVCETLAAPVILGATSKLLEDSAAGRIRREELLCQNYIKLTNFIVSYS